jgi:hypothetical protein
VLQRLTPSIEMMAPGAPLLEVLAARPRSPGVVCHTIAAVAPVHRTILERALVASWDEKGDGVVTLASARLEAVKSRRVIAANHTEVKHHPQTVAELRRILREHVGLPPEH